MKFRVGDRVKCVMGICMGLEGIVTKITEGNNYTRIWSTWGKNTKYDSYLPEHELELVKHTTKGGEKIMAEFKVGDRVKVKIPCFVGSKVGDIHTVMYERNSSILAIYRNDNAGDSVCDCPSKWEKVNSADEAMTFTRVELTEAQKKNLSATARALVEAGYYTSDLRVADEKHFVDFLANMFETEYAKQAQAELDEADKIEKKTKK